jgi:hypothetical protein
VYKPTICVPHQLNSSEVQQSVKEKEMEIRGKRKAEMKQKERQSELDRGRRFRVIVVVKPAESLPAKLHIDKDGRAVIYANRKYGVDWAFDAGFKIHDVHSYLVGHTPHQRLTNGRIPIFLAYGPTGTGKTRLMTRGDGDEVSLITSVLSHYREKLHAGIGANTWHLTIEALEIYNNCSSHFFDRNSKQFGPTAKVSLDGTVRDPRPRLIGTNAELNSTMNMINTNRATAKTKFNSSGSSRSHLVLACKMQCGENIGRLVFVDLAGTEAANLAPEDFNATTSSSRVRTQSEREKQRYVANIERLKKESKEINLDLEELRTKVFNLSTNACYASSRMLSRVLKPYLECADVTFLGTVAADGESGQIKSTLDLVRTACEVRRTGHGRNKHVSEAERS